MALTPTIINLSSGINIIRSKINSLLNDFINFTITSSSLTVDLDLDLNGDADISGSLTNGGVQVSLNGHDHDDLYYTETEIDTNFYTKTAIGSLLNSYFKLDGSLPITGDIIQRNGTGDQEHSLEQYSEYVDSSNYSRSVLRVVDDPYGDPVVQIGAENAGTGTAMEIEKVQGIHKLREFIYNGEVIDDAYVLLPTIEYSAKGWVIIGDNEEHTDFYVDSTGTVTLVNNSTNVVANADTDENLCIGSSATQEPLQIKNRLGGIKRIMLKLEYY